MTFFFLNTAGDKITTFCCLMSFTLCIISVLQWNFLDPKVASVAVSHPTKILCMEARIFSLHQRSAMCVCTCTHPGVHSTCVAVFRAWVFDAGIQTCSNSAPVLPVRNSLFISKVFQVVRKTTAKAASVAPGGGFSSLHPPPPPPLAPAGLGLHSLSLICSEPCP